MFFFWVHRQLKIFSSNFLVEKDFFDVIVVVVVVMDVVVIIVVVVAVVVNVIIDVGGVGVAGVVIFVVIVIVVFSFRLTSFALNSTCWKEGWLLHKTAT